VSLCLSVCLSLSLSLSLSLCLSVTMSVCPCVVGELKQQVGGLKAGAERVNCGVDDDCGDSAFSVQLYSGDRNIDPPKICVNGK